MSDEADVAIATVRAEFEAERAAEEQRVREAEASRLRTLPPEAREWRPDPWPTLTPAEQSAAVETARS